MKAHEAQKLAAQRTWLGTRNWSSRGGPASSNWKSPRPTPPRLTPRSRRRWRRSSSLELDLEFSRITSPIAGRIGRRELTEGNLVNAGGSDPLLTTIVAQNPVYVYFSVDERSLQRYMQSRPSAKEGDTPRCFASGRSRSDLVWIPTKATLTRGCSTLPTTAWIPTRARSSCAASWRTSKGLFVPGSRVRVRVPVSEPYSAVLVPDTAILSDQDERYLLVVDDKNVVSRRDMTPGELLDDGMRVILPGRKAAGVTPEDGSSCLACSGLASTTRWIPSRRPRSPES